MQMKKIFYWTLACVVVLASCKKYNSLGFTPGKGAPTITSVHTLSKTDTAAANRQVLTLDSSGKVDTTNLAYSGQPYAFDSVTDAGNLGEYVVLYGSNLGSATTVTFNGNNAYFDRAWMTDNTLIVEIPSNTPTYGAAANDTLTVTTLYGKVSYHFVVLPPPPTIQAVTDYDFWNGSQITLTGLGFADVTSIGLTNSNAAVTIVSQNDSTLVLSFPSTTISRANLVFNYMYNGAPTKLTSTQEFVDLDNAYNLFAFGAFQNGFGDWSWTHPSTPNPVTGPTHSYGQTQSFELVFPNGSWQMEGFGTGTAAGQQIFSTYTYYTFWIYGGVQTETITISANQLPYVWQQPTVAGIFTITVPPGVWSYFKIPIGGGAGQIPFVPAATAQANMNAASNNLVSWFIPGPNGVNETFYVDEVAFVK